MMDQEQQREILQRLKSAQKRSQEAFEKTEIGWDLHPGTQIANWWPFIAAGYSGIEQSFKFLLAVNQKTVIRELLKSPKYRTHNLLFLFQGLDKKTQRILREYYRRFHSLHNYIRTETLEDFLKEVSGKAGKGYEQWRYALIEPGRIPPNSVDCMMAIWEASVQLITKRQHPKQEILMPEQQLLRKFEDAIRHVWRNTILLRQVGHKEDTNDALDKWCEDYGHPINAFAQLIWNDYRGITTENLVDLNWLAKLLSLWLDRIKDLRNNNNQTSLSYFIERARGNTRDGLGIRWDEGKKQFESIPWNMEEIALEIIPSTAQKMEGEKTLMRDRILQRVYNGGFDVKENQFRGKHTRDEIWMCTLLAEKEQISGEKLVVKVWEQKWDSDSYVEVQGACLEETTEVQELIQDWAAEPD